MESDLQRLGSLDRNGTLVMTTVLLPDLTSAKRANAGREVLTFRHRLDETGLFSDAALARLIDETPRDKITIRTRGRRTAESWISGEAGHLNGADLVAAARKGHLWIEMPAVQNIRYARVFDRLMDEFGHALGLRLLEADAQVVIASPNMDAVFRVDTVETMALHVRGQEVLQVHAPTAPQLHEQRLEAILREEAPADLPADQNLSSGATPILLRAGEAAWWPLHSPHRSVSGDDLNVWMAVNFVSTKTRRANRVVYASGFLRRVLGLRDNLRLSPKLLLPLYLVVGKLLKRLPRRSIARPSPLTRFEVDLRAPGCIRWRRRVDEHVRRAA